MILKRCDKGHYYDGEIHRECPRCMKILSSGSRQESQVQGKTYSQDDLMTVALRPAGLSVSLKEDSQAVSLLSGSDDVVYRRERKLVVGWLLCIGGNDFGDSFTVKLGKNYIGRSGKMDIVLHGDSSIAMEQHAAIYYVPQNRKFVVEPGQAGKRLYLNKKMVLRAAWIREHDVLAIGNVSLMFFPCCGEQFSWEDVVKENGKLPSAPTC